MPCKEVITKTDTIFYNTTASTFNNRITKKDGKSIFH